MKTTTLLALALLTLALPASADSTATADLVGQAVSIEGDAALIGDLLALRSRDPEGATAPLESFFEIQAAQLRVETDASDFYAEAGGVVYPGQVTPGQPGSNVHQEQADYTDASLVGTESRASRILHLFPLSDLEASSSCSTVEPTDEGLVNSPSKFNTRTAISRDVSEALELVPCAGTDLTVTGSFVVVLWEWDADLQSAEGSASLWSGKAPQDADPQGNLEPYVSKAQQLYLTIQDGSLRIPGSADHPPVLFLADGTIEGASHVTLTQATGQLRLPDAVDVDADVVELRGDVSLDLTRSADQVNVQATGWNRADVDGDVLEVEPSATVAASERDWPWWTLAVGLVAVIALALVVRHVTPWSPYCYEHALTASQKGRIARASMWAWLATRQHEDGDPHLLRADLLLLRQRLDGCLDEHEAAHQAYEAAQNVEQILRNAFHAALVTNRLDRIDETRAWLQRAIEANPILTYRGLMQPEYEALRTLALRFGEPGSPGYA